MDKQNKNSHPIKAVRVRKILTADIYLKGDSDEEVEYAAYKMAKKGTLDKLFADSKPYYEAERYESYKEGSIDENLILKE